MSTACSGAEEGDVDYGDVVESAAVWGGFGGVSSALNLLIGE